MMHIGEWVIPDSWWLITIEMMIILMPFVLMGAYSIMGESYFIRRNMLERKICKEIRSKKWKNNKRRATDSLHTFLANDVRRYDR